MPDQQLALIAVDSPLRAQELLTAAIRLQTEGKIVISDAVFITKDADGKTRVVETTDPTPGSAALSSGFWGLLFGAILAVPIAGLVVGAAAGAATAAIVDTGVPDEFVKQSREALQPGTTGLALLVGDIDRDAVLEEMRRFPGAELLLGTFTPDAVERIQAALADSPSTAADS